MSTTKKIETCLCCGLEFTPQYEGDRYCDGCTEDAGFWGETWNLLDGAEPEAVDE